VPALYSPYAAYLNPTFVDAGLPAGASYYFDSDGGVFNTSVVGPAYSRYADGGCQPIGYEAYAPGSRFDPNGFAAMRIQIE
jgi:hypothetical protein